MQVGSDDGGHECKAEKFPLHPVVSEGGHRHSHNCNSHPYLAVIMSRTVCQCFAYIISVDPHNNAGRLASLPHFTNEETESQRDKVICLGSHSSTWQSQD